MPPKYSLVIPCYNEAENLDALFSSFLKLSLRPDFELVLVDNGSSDDTGAIIEEKIKGGFKALKVSVDKNTGYGNGILEGLKAASGVYIGWTHADLQFPVSSVEEALKTAETLGKRKIFVKGLRKNRSLSDIFFTGAMAAAASLYTGEGFRDINGQPVFFSGELKNSWKNPPLDFALDFYAYASAIKNGFEIVRFPVLCVQRNRGVSSWNSGLVSKFSLARKYLRYFPEIKTFLRGK